MSGKPFFDTNTLLYLVSDDAAKADRAESLLRAGGVVSVQVLNEITQVCVRKLRMDWSQTDALLAAVRNTCRVESLTLAGHDLGRQLAERYRVSVYDAMILASGLLSGAETLYSEDLHDGLRVNGQLTVCNPFRPRRN